MITQLIALVKTLLMKDADPTELNKPWWMRRRTVQKILAIVGVVLYFKWGLVLDNDVKDTLADNYEVITSSVAALIAAVMTVWGVIGAIVGQKGATKKLKAALKECQQPPQPIAPDKVEPVFKVNLPPLPQGGTAMSDPNPPESPRNP